MKFIHYLEGITGVGIFPLIGLLIFVVFFVLMLIYVFGADKKHMQQAAKIPLD